MIHLLVPRDEWMEKKNVLANMRLFSAMKSTDVKSDKELFFDRMND